MIDIGSRRECFFDDFLIDTEKTTARLTLGSPQKREIVMTHDKPWEGDYCGYYNFFFDDQYPGFDGKHPEGVYIFLFPPSLEVLEERLKGRGTETDEVIAKRLARAKEEFKMCTKYNYYVVNDDLEKAVEEIEAIIVAEKARKERNQVNLEF